MEGDVNQCPQAAPGRAAKDWLGHVRVVKEAPRVRRETKYREGVSASYKKSNSNEGYCYEWNYLFFQYAMEIDRKVNGSIFP